MSGSLRSQLTPHRNRADLRLRATTQTGQAGGAATTFNPAEQVQPTTRSTRVSKKAGETLLIRGGTSSVGFATLAVAKQAALKMISTSRSEAKVDVLKAAGADEVVLTEGTVAEQARALHPEGQIACCSFDQLPVAHQAMGENRANGKMMLVAR